MRDFPLSRISLCRGPGISALLLRSRARPGGLAPQASRAAGRWYCSGVAARGCGASAPSIALLFSVAAFSFLRSARVLGAAFRRDIGRSRRQPAQRLAPWWRRQDADCGVLGRRRERPPRRRTVETPQARPRHGRPPRPRRAGGRVAPRLGPRGLRRRGRAPRAVGRAGRRLPKAPRARAFFVCLSRSAPRLRGHPRECFRAFLGTMSPRLFGTKRARQALHGSWNLPQAELLRELGQRHKVEMIIIITTTAAMISISNRVYL